MTKAPTISEVAIGQTFRANGHSPTANSAPSAGADTPTADLDPATVKRIADVRARLLSTFGQVTLMLTAVPRYRHQSIADLHHLVLEPLIRNRLTFAKAKPKEEMLAANGIDGAAQIAGIAIWASVSDEVDAAIREQIKAGMFPVRLKANDWSSGKTMWLLDVIAQNRKAATAVLANFLQIAKGRDVHIHPAVTRMVDPDFLKKAAKPTGSDEAVADTQTEPVKDA